MIGNLDEASPALLGGASPPVRPTGTGGQSDVEDWAGRATTGDRPRCDATRPRAEGGDMSHPAVVIVDYDPRWPLLFDAEQQLLLGVLGPRALAIEHVGSTSVPGLGAKPIIDISVGVHNLMSAVDDCREPLQGLGYEYIPMPGLPDLRLFRRGPWRAATHHVHLVEFGGARWHRYLLFRDHLRARPDVAHQYDELKRGLAIEHGANRSAYQAAKMPFIDAVLAEAGAANLAAVRR